MGYYILQNNETKGPYTLNQLKSMWSSGAITGNLQYCEEGYTEWLPLSDLQPVLEPEPQRLSAQTRMLLAEKHPSKSRGIYIILGLFLGIFGVHDFYAGRYRRGVDILLCTVLLGWLVIGLIISIIIVIVELCTVTEDGDGQRMA